MFLPPNNTAARWNLRQQVAKNALQPLRIEYIGGLRERTQRGSRTAEFLLHLIVQLSVAGSIPCTTDIVQTMQQRRHLVEIFQSLNIAFVRDAKGVRTEWHVNFCNCFTRLELCIGVDVFAGAYRVWAVV